MRDGENVKLLAGHHAGMLYHNGARERPLPFQGQI
jgi:hypothetical protein